MLITKFNRMIRNRVLWGAFAVVICVSFVLAGYGGRSCGEEESQQGLAGKLDGEEISRREFYMARLFELGMQEQPGLSPEMEAALRDRTWQRLAALRTARDLGVTVSDEELRDVLRRNESFRRNGAFDGDLYRATVRQRLGVSVPTFEAFLRQDLILRKLMQVSEAMAWTPPTELARHLGNLTDMFQLEYTHLSVSNHVPDVDLDMQQVRAYYEANPERFREPDKINVRYVRLPISNYLERVTIQDDAVTAYYEEHRTEFEAATTNDTIEVLPLDEVRGEIVTNLRERAAMFAARSNAMDLVVAMTPYRRNPGMDFGDAAAARGFRISTSEFFTAEGGVPGLDAGYDFVRTAFRLDKNDPQAYFSDPLVTDEAVFVIAAQDRIEEHVPDFDAISNAVYEAALDDARSDALIEKAAALRQAVVDAVATGKTFTAAVEAQGYSVSTTATFTVYESTGEEFPYARAAIPAIRNVDRGRITEPIPTADGALIAYVAERTPGSVAEAEDLRPQLGQQLSRFRTEMVFSDWSESLLADREFENYMRMDTGPEAVD